jgi:hypothetical protein
MFRNYINQPRLQHRIPFVNKTNDYVFNSCGADLLFSVKIAYHCFSCDKKITDIETAEEHSKSLSHEVNETIQRADEDRESFLV